MFSKSCEYGIRAVIIICENSKQGLVINVKEICSETNVPEQYLAKILQKLSRKKVISSIKGPKGGFFLDKQQQKLKLIDLVQAIDGDELFVGCGLGLQECSEITPCPLHKYIKTIRHDLKYMLQITTIGKLAKDVKKQLLREMRMSSTEKEILPKGTN